MARSEFAMSASAALILVAAAAWMASPLRRAAGAEPSAESPGPEPLAVRGIVVRDERLVPEPEGEYIVLAGEGERVAAGGAVLACAEGREGLANAVRDAARENPSVTDRALREAVRAAASDGEAFMLRAIYSPGTDAPYELVSAPASAVWTSRADGYEYLTPASLDGLTAAKVREMLAAAPEDVSGAAGKLVYSGVWRYAAVLPDGAEVQAGESVTLEFDGFSVSADVECAEGSAAVFITDEAPDKALALRAADARVLLKGS